MPTNSSEIELDQQQLQVLIEQCCTVARQAVDHELVLVVGNTGAGKSSIINYLLGCPMALQVDEALGEEIIVVKSGAKEFAKIGHKISHSETLFPSVILTTKGYAICDCPGFGETRGIEQEIATLVGTKMVINAAKSIKHIIVVLEQGAIIVGRGAGLTHILRTLDALLVTSNQAQTRSELEKSISFVVTKKHPGNNSVRLLKRYRDERQQDNKIESKEIAAVCDLMLEDPTALIEMNYLDDGETRHKIFQRVIQSSPLSPNQFDLPAGASTRLLLHRYLVDIAMECNQVVDIIESRDVIIRRCSVELTSHNSQIQIKEKKILAILAQPYADDNPSLNILRQSVKEHEDYFEQVERQYAQAVEAYAVAYKKIEQLDTDISQLKDSHKSQSESMARLMRTFSLSTSTSSSRRWHNLSMEGYERRITSLESSYDRAVLERNKLSALLLNTLSPDWNLKSDRLAQARTAVNKVRSQYVELLDRLRNAQQEQERKEIVLLQRDKCRLERESEALISSKEQAADEFKTATAKLSCLILKSTDFVRIIMAVGRFNDTHIGKTLVYFAPDNACKFITALSHSANTGCDSSAMFALAYCYDYGFGITVNKKLANSFLEKAAEKNHPEALYLLGNKYLNANKPFQAAKYFHRASASGHEQAGSSLQELVISHQAGIMDDDGYSLYFLGRCFGSGVYFKQSDKKAVDYFMAAKAQNHVLGIWHVGLAYENGSGVNKDLLEALRTFAAIIDKNVHAQEHLAEKIAELKEAAKLDDATAQYQYAVCCQEGIGIPKKPKAAAKYFQLASLKLPLARYKLAQCHENGTGVAVNLLKAIEQYHFAAEAGIKPAKKRLKKIINDLEVKASNDDYRTKYILAKCYLTGYGLIENSVLAQHLMLDAADNSVPEAMYELASWYNKGEYVKQNSIIALRWHKKALAAGYLQSANEQKMIVLDLERRAEAGNVHAQECMGCCFNEGLGDLSVNVDKAAQWWREAKRKNSAFSYNQLAMLFEKNISTQANVLSYSKRAQKSMKYRRKAAQLGSANANLFLAQCREKGIHGVKQNMDKAKKLYQTAERLGL